MQLVDTHCHIHSQDYPLAVAEAEQRALEADVGRLICVGTDAVDSQRALAFVQDRPTAWASVGLHPHDAKDGEGALQILRTLVEADAALHSGRKVVAIGECGLDYYYSHSPKKEQEKALRYQIELAQEYNLPLIFHIRDAFDDFWPIFDCYQGLRGVVHSFTDNRQNLGKILARHLLVGVNGIMTFTKNDWQLEVAKAIPLKNLLLETDAPFLTPNPYRGRVNEPARVRTIAEFLAELRGESLADIATSSTQNARQLFSI